jgi:hypothetical protein
MLIEKPELSRLQIETARFATPGSRTPMSLEDMTIRNYLLLLYGLFERAHLLYRKKWIDEETWNQWSAFLESVAKHPLFVEAHRTSEGMFDKPFQDYVTDTLNRKR